MKAEELKDYYRIKVDARDLNYNKYFSEGERKISLELDYSSFNTKRLSLEEIKQTLLSLDYIKNELNA